MERTGSDCFATAAQGAQAEAAYAATQGDALQGTAGPSAYDVAVANGFVGTEAAWLASLVGPTGLQGPAGADSTVPGPQGSPGADSTIPGPQGLPGADSVVPGPPGAPGDASAAWPIGSVFLAVVPTNPATLLGFGAWAAIGAGRMLVGFNALDPDFDADEKTGGEKAHTLTAAEMPVHTHVQDQHRHQTLRERSAVTGAAATQIARTADTSSTVDTGVFTEYTTPTNQNAGSGAAHNNLPPYIAVHLWKRTA